MKLDASLLQDQDYLNLPEIERAKVAEHLAARDSDVMQLDDTEKAKVLNYFVSYGINKQKTPVVQTKQQEDIGDFASNIAAPFVSGIKNIGGAIIEPAAQMATGLFAKPISEIAGMAAAGRELVSPIGGDPEAFKRAVAEKLTYQPQTEGGKFVSENILAPVGEVMGYVPKKLGEFVKEKTGSEVAASGAEEAAMQAINLGLATKGASTAREANIAKAQALKEQQANNILRDSIRKEGQKIGLIAPSEGFFKETLAKQGGAEPHISLKNTQTATNAIAEEVGLPKGAISDADIATRVSELSNDYGIVTKALGNNVPIKLDFKRGVYEMLDPMKEKFAQDPKAFAALKGPIELLEQQVKQSRDAQGRIIKQTILPEIVMDKIRQLRSDARKFDKDTTGDPAKGAMAETNYKLANLYEDLMENVLKENGKTALLEKFRDSRKKLSQIHVIDSARTAEGWIDMQRLASVIGKYAADKKMVTGNIKTVADFANTFKDVSKPVGREGFSTPSRWETMYALGGVAAAPHTGGGSLIMTAPMAARAIAPTLGERGMLQGKVPSYELSRLRRALPATATGLGLFGQSFRPYKKENEQ